MADDVVKVLQSVLRFQVEQKLNLQRCAEQVFSFRSEHVGCVMSDERRAEQICNLFRCELCGAYE